jgi:hypothetical protein
LVAIPFSLLSPLLRGPRQAGQFSAIEVEGTKATQIPNAESQRLASNMEAPYSRFEPAWRNLGTIGQENKLLRQQLNRTQERGLDLHRSHSVSSLQNDLNEAIGIPLYEKYPRACRAAIANLMGAYKNRAALRSVDRVETASQWGTVNQ